MPILLFIIGAIAVMVGVGMVAFGIPINEFSFGNTLIVAGTTATTGGLIVIGLGAAVGQLRRIAETLAARTPARAGHPLETVEELLEAPMAPPAATRVPFPPKPTPEPTIREPLGMRAAPPTEKAEEHRAQSFAPTLRNPDAPPLTVEDERSLSPSVNGSGAAQQRHEAGFEPPWRSPAAPPAPREVPGSNFDAMWPAESKPPRSPMGGEAPPMPRPEQPPREPAAPPEMPELPVASQPRAVAILKSGVVDGMDYTLYVDGSIEAVLPQGTVRFASIEELRSHLERNS
jgi:hypothetical protein